MRRTVPLRTAAVVAAVALAASPLHATQRGTRPPKGAAPDTTPQELARVWDAEHVSPPRPPLLEHDEVERRVKAVADADPGRFAFERVGESLEGRSVNMITTGHGPSCVLLWSQMHLDEPTATAAFFDVFEYFEHHADDPTVRRILSSLTLHIVPMLNPDGAERFQRRNAQGIDVNRDALRLQTPEGRLLKALRDRLNPSVGFNLHNQSWRTSVGDPPQPASISLLSVAFDKQRTENRGRLLTKKICAVIRDALEPFASGQIGRYADEFGVRAFGDNLTLWGTPVVLIETGPWPSSEPDAALVRLNFVALVSALDAVASGSVNKADPQRYETLPMNETKELYVLIKNATVLVGNGVPPFGADVGVTADRRVRLIGGRREIQIQASIDDLGDLRTRGALRTIDATGLLVAPLVDPSWREGQEVELPDFKKQPAPHTVAPGQPGELALLRPTSAPNHYVVDTLLRY